MQTDMETFFSVTLSTYIVTIYVDLDLPHLMQLHIKC